jgi:hypothetical protein
LVEQGLVILVQTPLAAAGPPLSRVAGGYGDILPKDAITPPTGNSPGNPMAWVYKTVSRVPDYIVAGRTGWTEWNVQIDCHGVTKANAIALRQAVWETLRGGFQGVMADPDATFIFGIYERDWPPSLFSDANRTFVEPLEYQVIYQQT